MSTVNALVLLTLLCVSTTFQQAYETSIELYRTGPIISTYKNDYHCLEEEHPRDRRRISIAFFLPGRYNQRKTYLSFNTDQVQFEEYPTRIFYYGWVSRAGTHPSNFAECLQFWIKLDNIEDFTSYECCVSKGYRVRLRYDKSKNRAFLEGYLWSRCLDSTSCKPKPGCEPCKNIGSPENIIYLVDATIAGYKICGGSGMEQAGCIPLLNVFVKGQKRRVFLEVKEIQ